MIIDGRSIAKKRKEAVCIKVEQLKEKGIVPGLVSVVVGDSGETALYVDLKQKAAESVGINFARIALPATNSTSEVVEVIKEKNIEQAVHGIWVQLPLPPRFDVQSIVSAIDPKKDVDCLTPHNLGLLFHPDPPILPATVKAVMTIIEETDYDLSGKRAVVVGSSPWLGKPLSLSLSNAGATVTSVWETEKNLSEIVRMGDLIVSAVGKPNLITAEMIKEDAVIIDVGISRVGEKIGGDVDFEKVKEKASYITPVPGGVGPLTVVNLLENTLFLAEKNLGD